jgi:4-amino-4-deoxy-L-arabinose transferase-like glycosyltransferase
MNARFSFTRWLRRSGWVLLPIALAQFALHLWTNAHDSIFRDEMYYLAAGQHLAGGYVDFPPFVALVAAFSRALFGTSPLAIRLMPALAGAAIVLLTADMVAMLGGGLADQALAATAIAVGPVFIGSSGLLTMDAFDQLWWALAAWVLLRMIKTQQPRLWLFFGLVAGLGLLTKLTMGFCVLALVIGLLLSQERWLLFNPLIILGGAIALVIVSPYLVWQVQHGFPILEFTKAYASGKTFQATPLEYFGQQVMTLNPLTLLLWLGGLYYLLFARLAKPYRAFGLAYVLLYLFFMLQKAKFYWLSPAYPMLLAAGAYALQLFVQRRPRLRWVQPAYLGLVAVTGLLIVPFAIPILPNETLMRMNAAIGGAGDVKQENRVTSGLPQNYADRYGWPEMVEAVRQAYDSLTPAEQAEACILTRNYGEAAAVDLFGPALGLPKAISGHNSYYLWGPRGCSGKVIITVNYALRDLSESFESVRAAGQVSCVYCMPDENGAPIFIGRGLKVDMREAWPTVKDFG